ncbi:Hypothetical protein GLP15_4405 [Giardia lamblia P15]|uniref:SET domain-containing protein n=1 Tax=Giardia intestinalis (strain P15) TaxID=658858 RepID=E1F362_GIAIA|nr:Hypothetical protein GLP15_4405 [Giardia lamblia P15]
MEATFSLLDFIINAPATFSFQSFRSTVSHNTALKDFVTKDYSRYHISVIWRYLTIAYTDLTRTDDSDYQATLLKLIVRLNLFLSGLEVPPSPCLDLYVLDAIYFALAHYRLTGKTSLFDYVVRSDLAVPPNMKQLFLPFIRIIHSKIYDANYIPDLLDLVVAVRPSVKSIAPGIYTQDAVLYMDEVIRKETSETVGMVATESTRKLICLKAFSIGDSVFEGPTDMTAIGMVNPLAAVCNCCGEAIEAISDPIRCPECGVVYCTIACREYDLHYHSHEIFCRFITDTAVHSFASIFSKFSLERNIWSTFFDASMVILHILAILTDKISIAKDVLPATLWKTAPELFLLNRDTITNYEWYRKAYGSPLKEHTGIDMIGFPTFIALFLGPTAGLLKVWPYLRPSTLYYVLSGVLMNGFAQVFRDENDKLSDRATYGVFNLSYYHSFVRHSCTPNFRRTMIKSPTGGTFFSLVCIKNAMPGDELTISYVETEPDENGYEHYIDTLATHNVPLCSCKRCSEILAYFNTG